MAHESRLRNQVELSSTEDEESNLISDNQTQYGATTTSTTSTKTFEEPCSEESSEEMISTEIVANRKKKRLKNHHRFKRPKLVTTLSHIVRSARQSEDEDDLNDVIEIPSTDLIIPELDPKYIYINVI